MMKSTILGLMVATWKSPPMFLLVVIITVGGTASSVVLMMSTSYWAAVLLVMIYISGVMVLFMYVASVSPYEKKKVSAFKKGQMVVLTLILIESLSPQTKIMSIKFSNTFETNTSSIMVATLMVVVMASILPMASINLNKGLKSSK